VGNWFSFKNEFSHAFCAPHSLHSWEIFLTIRFHHCLTLGRDNEYNHIAKALKLTTPTILSEYTIVALRQQHLPPSDLVPPLIFYY
jgi:hypothetical protein